MIKNLIKSFRVIGFFFTAISNRLRLTSIDKKSPFKGTISNKGYLTLSLSENSIKHLNEKIKLEDVSKNVRLNLQDKNLIFEIFSKLKDPIDDYLGNEVYLDGIEWIRTTSDNPKNKTNISTKWHVDNVGNRLKCFVCVFGDGTQPTVVVPTEKPVPSFLKWLQITFIESLRWIGFNSNFKIKNQEFLYHKSGSINIFDTQLLHRGDYEEGNQERLILELEFSKKEKHNLTNGPIGTTKTNSFLCNLNLIELDDFKKFIDYDRLVKIDDNYFKYEKN